MRDSAGCIPGPFARQRSVNPMLARRRTCITAPGADVDSTGGVFRWGGCRLPAWGAKCPIRRQRKNSSAERALASPGGLSDRGMKHKMGNSEAPG